MSAKTVILVALVVGAGYWLTRARPPVPPGATAADSAAVAQAGIGARFQYGIGSLGCKIVGSSVRGMVSGTEQSLRDMHPAVKASRDKRAREYAAKTARLDSLAMVHLQTGHPLQAMQGAMNAKSMLSSVRDYTR